jgi:protein-L-isoaspartate O-methyltransferase
MPGLMTRMLETLDVRDGHRVLEIGAGTGYNAALLCHRLGAEHVFAVDIEPDLVALARQRLAHLGYYPTLVAADGVQGLPEHAPYDRIVATCSVPAVPWAWVAQTRKDGLILVDVKIGQQAGNLVLLRRCGQRIQGQRAQEQSAQGRFDPTYGSFMSIRRAGDTSRHQRLASASQNRDGAHRRTTTLELTRPWEQTAFWFFAHLVALPPGTTFSLRGEVPDQPPRNTVLHCANGPGPDGSWCEVREDSDEHGSRAVWETGPHPLWRLIEDSHAQWRQLGRPGWERLGLTVTAERHRIWLDSPEGEHSWDLTHRDTERALRP